MDKYLQNLIASGADPVLIAKLSQESPNMPEPSPTVTEPGRRRTAQNLPRLPATQNP
jgi:hypothetical protein